jgi:glycosyltransferase involved in cell wall biosynthesis
LRVYFTPHVAHYNIGLVDELSKYIEVVVVTDRIELAEGLEDVRRGGKCLKLYVWRWRGHDVVSRALSFGVRIGVGKLLAKLSDVVHANTSLDAIRIGIVDGLVVTEHGYPDPLVAEDSLKPYYRREAAALTKLYSIGVPIVTISKFSAVMLRRLYSVKAAKVVYHGVLDTFRATAPRSHPHGHVLRILWVSRLVRAKEPEVFIKALAKLRGKLDFIALVIGDGPLRSAFEKFIRMYDLEGRVRIVSRLPFKLMPRLYHHADVYVHTASKEAFGLSVLEAMASGLPVVVPRHGGAYEVAGSAALTFAPGNSEELAELIQMIAGDKDLYAKLSRRSLERSRLFTWKKAALEYLDIYKKVAGI